MSDTTSPQPIRPVQPAPVVRAKLAPYQNVGIFAGYISIILWIFTATEINPFGWLDTGIAWAFFIMTALLIGMGITIIFMVKARKNNDTTPTDNS